jgi:F0F1-type ATP synthase membrane subunit b/b'
VIRVGGTSEREFFGKIVKTKGRASKMVNDVRSDFAKMQKLKAESLKKIEEMRRSAEANLEKLEREAAKSKDLVPESRKRITVEIVQSKKEIQQKYEDFKARISASIVPE